MKKEISKLELLLNRISDQKVTGIKLPIRKSEYDRYANLTGQLLDRKLISKKLHDESLKEQLSRTLDEDTYELFYECLLEEKGRKIEREENRKIYVKYN